jgi:hypothetical protein
MCVCGVDVLEKNIINCVCVCVWCGYIRKKYYKHTIYIRKETQRC